MAERSSEPTAVFSIGAQLLRVDNNKLLGSLLASVGLDIPDLSALDSNGLANTSITSAGLLRALGVKLSVPELKILSPKELVELVNTEVGLVDIEKLITASATLVGNHTVEADADAAALKTALLSAQLENLQLNVLATETSSGLLSLASGRNGEIGAALDTHITLGEVLKTAILTGVSGRAIHVPELNILGPAVSVELGIIEPPSLAVGPVGATAYNAQVRLHMDIDSDKILGGLLSGPLRPLIDLRVHLPLSVDVTTAQATFASAKCYANPPTATFDVDSTLLNACIGDIPDEFKWSASKRCEEHLQKKELVRLKPLPSLLGLFGIDGVELNSKVHIAGFTQDNELTDLRVNPAPKVLKDDAYFTKVNEIKIGDTISGKGGIVDGLLDLLAGLFRKPVAVPNIDYIGNDMASIKIIARSYLDYSQENGRYNIPNVTKLVLEGRKNQAGEQLLPPLVENNDDWYVGKVIPKKCLILCAITPLLWEDGNFSETLDVYSKPTSILGLLLPTTKDGLTFCGNLISDLLNWNSCIENNLVKLLQDKRINVSFNDNSALLDPKNESTSCNGLLCTLLKPALVVLKPILNKVGKQLISTLLGYTLGLELGRSALAVHDINCGAPRLVSMGSEEK